MRTFLSGLLTLVAMVACVVAVPAMWVSERLVDEDGFVSVVTPMAKDARVKDYLATEITDQAVSRADQLGGGVINQPVAALVMPVAQRYTNSAGFSDDFVNLVRQQHSWLFDDPAPGTDRSVMRVNITPMVNRVIAEVLPNAARVPGPVEIELDSGNASLEAGHYHHAGEQITRLGWVATIVAAAAALLALVVARRRGTVLAWLGLGLGLSAAVAWGAGRYLAREARTRVHDVESNARQVADLFVERCTDDLTRYVLIVGGVGAGLLVLGVIGRLVFPGRRP